jgi:aerobic carbon-monoxide dehydrogenase large subunit
MRDMTKFGSSQPVKRLEDTRFLTGRGRYIDDTVPEGSLRCFVLRSPMAHGRLTALDVSDAREAPGVVAVYTAADLTERGLRNSMKGSTVPNRDGTKGAAPVRPILAEDRVRHVGEALAFVVAETLAQARDAAELIVFDIDDLPVKLDIAPGGETLHDAAPGNVAYDWAHGDEEATEAALRPPPMS